VPFAICPYAGHALTAGNRMNTRGGLKPIRVSRVGLERAAYSSGRASRRERTTKPSKARKPGMSRGETSSSAWSRAAVTVTVRDALEGVR
jgi:hypothetical protein